MSAYMFDLSSGNCTTNDGALGGSCTVIFASLNYRYIMADAGGGI
jgi:hypothetical protein